VTQIELGEPTRYDPGTAPLMGRKDLALLRRRAKRALAAAAILGAGAAAGTLPATVALPQIHQVGRFSEHTPTIVADDLVVSISEDQESVTASAVDGSGARWQRFFPGYRVDTVGRAGNVVLAFIQSVGSDGAQKYAQAVRAFDVRTGADVWQREGSPLIGLGEGPVLVLQLSRSDDPLIGVDVASGRELWRHTVPPGSETIVVEPAVGAVQELLVAGAGGAIQPIRVATGEAGTLQRTASPGPVLFAWDDLVIRQVDHTTAYAEIAVYRRGESQPLWSREFTSEVSAWSCGPWFCMHAGQDDRVDPYTGAVAGQSVEADEARSAAMFGNWEPIGGYAGQILVQLDPGWTADAKTWLGVVVRAGPTYRVHPLMALGGRVNSCTMTAQWLYCAGSALADAVSIQLSDLDALLAEGGLDGADRSG